MKYGKTIKPKELIDENGSNKQVTITYRGGIPMQKTRYEMRVRVANETEELAEYVRFRKEHTGSNVDFRVEKPNKDNGYYHIVKCWEE